MPGRITPPFGLEIFVINAMARDIPMSIIYRGILPFVASGIVRIPPVPYTVLSAPSLW